MTRRIAGSELDRLEETGGRDAAAHLQRAETLAGWASDERYELADGLRRAQTLLAAAEHFELAGRLDRALEAALAAGAADDALPHETAGTLVSVRLARGERDAAIAAADLVRADPAADWTRRWEIAEAFELAGESALAERWFTIALRAADRAGRGERDRMVLLSGRYRARRDAGKPLDVLDADTEEVRARLGQEPLA